MSTDSLNKTPSLIHLAKLLGDTPTQTAANILKLRDARPPRVIDAQQFVSARLNGMSAEALTNSAERLPDSPKRRTAMEIIPLADEFYRNHQVDWFKPYKEPILFQASPTTIIPMSPLGYGKIDGKVKWVLSLIWKHTSLSAWQFSYTASVFMKATQEREPDISGFLWLEMSAPKKAKARELRVRDNNSAQFLSDEELAATRDHIDTALAIVAQTPRRPRKKREKQDPNQKGFWDPASPTP